MRLLFLIKNLNGGGAEKVLTDIVNNLDYNKYDITVMTIENTGIYCEQLNPHIQYKTIIKKPNRIKNALFWRIVKCLPRKFVYHFFIREQYDVEIAFLEGLPTRILSGSTSKNKKVTWMHTDLSNNNYVEDYFRSFEEHKKCYQSYDKIVCVSQKSKEGFLNWYGENDSIINYVTVITNLIDSKKIQMKSKDALPELTNINSNTQAPILCNVGRLTHIKGHTRLLNAHKRLLNAGIPNRLWLVGTGSEKENLENFIRNNHLEDTVTLWGFHQNPYPFVKNADIFVLSSYAEGYPLCLAEALVLETPIISTHCSGTNEILCDGKYGMITENSEEGLYNGLYSVLSNPDALYDLQEKAKAGSTCFDMKIILEQIDKVLLHD